MSWKNWRPILAAVVIAVLVWPAVGQANNCTPDEWMQHIRTVVLPSRSSIAPEGLASTWPGGLKQSGSGSSATWSHLGPHCAVYFVFAPRDTGPSLRLVRLRLMFIGARAELSSLARVVASAVGPVLTQDELRALNQQEEVRSLWRVPADQSVSGVIRSRTLTLARSREGRGDQKSSWQLEMSYDDFPDAPSVSRDTHRSTGGSVGRRIPADVEAEPTKSPPA
jgi:hypothetical protein